MIIDILPIPQMEKETLLILLSRRSPLKESERQLFCVIYFMTEI
jgi:hypothetical protein